jgi:nitric oxide reductase NorQ protein
MNTPFTAIPYYRAVGNDESNCSTHAWRNRLPVLIKGPTGCGKTRFVAHMAARLGLPLTTWPATTTSPPPIWSGAT